MQVPAPMTLVPSAPIPPPLGPLESLFDDQMTAEMNDSTNTLANLFASSDVDGSL
jgi:hypothetical protein